MSELRFEDFYELAMNCDAVIHQRRQTGESFSSIAKSMGISVTTAQHKDARWPRLERYLKLAREVLEHRRNGKRIEEITDIMGKNKQEIVYLENSWRTRLTSRRYKAFRKSGAEYGYA